MPELLPDGAVAQSLARLDGWARVGGEIHRSVTLSTFPDAVAFVVRVGFAAEALDHHPDIDIRWRTVHLVLTTHSAGGITDLDVELAARVDEIARAVGASS